MNRKFSVAIVGALLSVASGVTLAASAAMPEGAANAIKSKLMAQFPDFKITTVRPAPWAGWYEIVAGEGQIAYTDSAASVLFTGDAIDVATRQNLTAKSWNEVHSIDFESLPFNLAMKTVKGAGSRRMAIFEDPLCPYCQQLEQQLARMENIRLYVFLYPLESIHPGATGKAAQIWCSGDRSQAWTGWMLNKTEPPAATDCDTQGLETIRILGRQLKIDSTPTIFLADGSRMTGVLSNDALEQRFASIAKAKISVSKSDDKGLLK